jgi:hypothetical protein
MDPMILSHKELRAALRIARREIVKLNFGKRDTPILQLIDRVQADAKAVALACGDSAIPQPAKVSSDRPNQAAAEQLSIAR